MSAETSSSFGSPAQDQWQLPSGSSTCHHAPGVLQEVAPEQGDAPKEGRRRLEDEPLLAARIVVEECLNCLLDLDDIDRMWVNSAAPRNDKAELQQRRSDLLEASPMRGFPYVLRSRLPAAPWVWTGLASRDVK